MTPCLTELDYPWLCLHFESLPLEVYTRGLAGTDTPVVVTERNRVAWLNDIAADLGILPGNSMDTAYTLSNSVSAFERDATREHVAITQLAGWAYKYTPNVSLLAPHSLLLDIRGCLKLFGGMEGLYSSIVDGLEATGYSALVGAAPTPMAALLLARAQKTYANLPEVPLEYLDVDSHIIDALGQMGISRLSELLALPKSGLNRRFGVFFVDYLQRLTGERPDPRKFVDPSPHFFSEITFPGDVDDMHALVFPMRRLLGELCSYLFGRQLATSHLTWQFCHRSHPPRLMNVYLASPECDQDLFFSLTQLQLDKVTDVSEMDSVSLSVAAFEDAKVSPVDLFEGTRFRQRDGKERQTGAEAQNKLLLNMFRARLGPQACFGLSEANDHRPEKAWKLVRPDVRDYWEPDTEPSGLLRPSLLLPKPKPLETYGGIPWLRGRLTLLQGPERIDFGWWDSHLNTRDDVARDYYVAKHESGTRFWVFQYHDRWYLHGLFA